MPTERRLLVPGDRVGPYVIHRHIGRGGMAEVFEATRQDGMIARPVAIKLLRCRWSENDPTIEKRFAAERQILAALNHPGIARLLDGGVTEGGTQYVVMEFVKGATLGDYVRKTEPGLSAKLQLFLGLCDAVHYAHRHLIVHRDIKPANVMVTDEGHVKLLDFGIAKLLRPELWRGVETPMTAPADRIATPEYAAPEQLRGEPVTTSSDVYSLGVIFYFLLTGRMPYAVENMLWSEIEYTIGASEPRPMNAFGGPVIPRDLEAIALAALRKEPGERYSSVEHFAEDIRRHLENRPVRARRGEWVYPALKFVRRHTAVTAMAGALLAVMTASGITLARQARLLAVESGTAKATTAFLFDLFDDADPNVSRQPTVREVLDEGTRRLWRDFQHHPWMRAALAEKLGGVYLNLGHYEQALPLAEEAVRVHRQLAGAQSLEAASSMLALADLLRHLKRFDRADSLAQEALAIRRRRLGPQAEPVAGALDIVGLLAQARGRAEESEEAFREAVAIRRLSQPPDAPRLALSLGNLGNVLLRERADYDEAFALFSEALSLRRKVWGDRHPRIAASLGRLSQMALLKKDPAEALRYSTEALSIMREAVPAGHPQIAAVLSLHGQALRASGRMQEAEAAAREMLQIHSQATTNSGPDSPEAAIPARMSPPPGL